MVVGGGTNLWEPDSSRTCLSGNMLGNVPEPLIPYPIPDAVAGERKLTTITPIFVLVHHTANGTWIGRVFDPV